MHELLVEVYENNAAKILRHLTQMVGSVQTAEDLLQDSVIKCMNSPVFTVADAPHAFMYRVALNTARDYLRSQNLRPTVYLPENNQIPDSNDMALRIETSLDLQRDLKHALEPIAPHYREVLLMQNQDQFSQLEIQNILNQRGDPITLSGVRTRAKRGRDQFIENYTTQQLPDEGTIYPPAILPTPGI
jgi:RNA polymerase sigma factor (sigma-70 family)